MNAIITLKGSGYIEIKNLKTIETVDEPITEFEKFYLQAIPYTFVGDTIASLCGEEIKYVQFYDAKNS